MSDADAEPVQEEHATATAWLHSLALDGVSLSQLQGALVTQGCGTQARVVQRVVTQRGGYTDRPSSQTAEYIWRGILSVGSDMRWTAKGRVAREGLHRCRCVVTEAVNGADAGGMPFWGPGSSLGWAYMWLSDTHQRDAGWFSRALPCLASCALQGQRPQPNWSSSPALSADYPLPGSPVSPFSLSRRASLL